MDDRIRKAGKFVGDTIRESAQQGRRDHGEFMYRQGFSSAVGIALRLIQDRTEAFKDQMKGSGLTKAEQAAYAQLEELRAEIEAECDRHWRGTGVDWRPPKQIAKGVVRRASQPDADEPEA